MKEKLYLLKGKDFWNIPGDESLGIQELKVSDGPLGIRNDNRNPMFPNALAATFNRELIEKVGKQIALSALSYDIDIVLGPAINIIRDPLCGRAFEYYSEDPFLAGEIGVSFVNGVQSEGIGACAKHYAVNSQEHGRFLVDEIVDDKALYDLYLRAFEKVVKQSQPLSIMTSYNKINGEYGSENKHLMQDIMRDEFGFKGIYISDWTAVDNHVKAIKAGLDVMMPNDRDFFLETTELALENKAIDIEPILERRKQIKTTKRKVEVDFNEQNELIKEVARQSIVLLKNENNILPLNLEDKYLVIGELFEHPVLQGGGSSRVSPTLVTTHKISFDKLHIQYDYCQGYSLDTLSRDLSLEKQARADIKNYVNNNSKYKAVLFFAGTYDNQENEGYDRDTLKLPSNQLELLDKLTDYYDNVIVIVSSGSAVLMHFKDDVAGIVQTNFLGQVGTDALAEILLGKVSPSGRLTITYPKLAEEVPAFYEFAASTERSMHFESIFVGYRYYLKKDLSVLFPFGHGLSYASFEYKNYVVKSDAEHISVDVDVSNTSSIDAYEVVQVYVSKKASNVLRATKELKGFAKVLVKANSSEHVNIIIPKSELSVYYVDRRIIEDGEYVVILGKDANNEIVSKVVKVHGEKVEPESTLDYLDNEFFTYDNFNRLYNKPLPKYVHELDYSAPVGQVSNYFARKIVLKLVDAALEGFKWCKLDRKKLSQSILNTPFRSVYQNAAEISLEEIDDIINIQGKNSFIKFLEFVNKQKAKNKPKK